VYATAMAMLAFVPVVLLGGALILLGGHAGGEIEHPLAVVVVGGLVTSTLVNLLLVPTLYAWTSPSRGHDLDDR